MKKNETVRIEITGMTNEGNGVGKYEEMAVFVPETAVGDIIDCKITKVLKSYAFGIVDRIITASEDRKESDCPVSKKCGGCSFRHISYDAELRIKDNFVRDAFKRIGKLDVPFEDIKGCDSQNYYRNKAQYPVADDNGKAVCGFYAKRSHRVIPYTHCLLQPEVFGEIVDYVMKRVNELKIKPYDEINCRGLLRHIYIRKGFHTDEIMVCFVVTSWKTGLETVADELISKFPDVKSVVLNKNDRNTNVIMGKEIRTIAGQQTICDIMCGNRIQLSPLSFYQVNTEAAEHLYSIAKEYAELTGKEKVLDLYCGAGTIGLSFADKAKSVTGVEIISQAVENAKINAELNKIKNAEFYCGDAGEMAQRFAENGESPDVIVVDPPRKGCDEGTLDAIVKMLPYKVVMISCNPATAARDCAILKEKGYTPVKARAVDMFPGTTHVECVTELVRKEN